MQVSKDAYRALAGVAAMFFGVFLALFVELVEKNRRRPTASPRCLKDS